MKRLYISILLLAGYYSMSFAQSLDSISPKLRDSILIGIARDVVLKYGPAYYRDYKKPEITRKIYPPKMLDSANVDRPYYIIAFYYDPEIEKEMLPCDYSYQVIVWADNWQPFCSTFGTGIGGIVSNSDGERIANLARKRFGFPTTKPDNYDYKLEYVEPLSFQPIKDKKQAESMRSYLIKKKIEKASKIKDDKNKI